MTVVTRAYYCHSCAAAAGMIPSLPPNFMPSSPQLAKEKKHTIVSSGSTVKGWLGVFTLTGAQSYWDFLVDPLASGCVEIDALGRRNVILVGSRQIGITYHNGAYHGPADSVKLAWAVDSSKIHPIPLPASLLNVGSCTLCGSRVPY